MKKKMVVEKVVPPANNNNNNSVFSIFSAKQHSSQPPLAPRPSLSGSSILAKNRLKNRLIVGWYGGNNNTTTSSSLTGNHAPFITKGFGEGLFEMSDSMGGLDDSMSIDSGLWTNLDNSSMFTMDDNKNEGGAGVYRAESSDLLSRRPAIIPRAESSYIEPERKQRINTSTVTSALASLTAAPSINTRVYDSTNVSVASTYQSSGWIGVARSIANGETEFCYIRSDDTDHYNFSLLENAPQSLLSNDYITLSKRGILRAIPNGDSEFIDYPTLLQHEQAYHKIKQIPVFGKYHLWKMFYMWKTNVHHIVYHRKAMYLKHNLCHVHVLHQRLILYASMWCQEIERLPIFFIESEET